MRQGETEQTIYDVVIVGAGPTGLACGIEAAVRELRHVILEKGCLVNSIYNYPTNMTFFSTSDRLEIGGVPFISHGYKPTRREALEYYRRVKAAWKLDLRTYERVQDVQGFQGRFKVVTTRGSYATFAVILAQGFYDNPNLLGVPGEELSKTQHYFVEAHPYACRKVAIIGGGNSAVDAALETFRHGAEVTLLVREPQLSPNIKYWVKPDIENRIREGSIKAHFRSEVKEILPETVIVHTPMGVLTLANDFVLAMTGYRPDYEFLAKIGVEVSNDEYQTPSCDADTLETNRKGIFLAGTACGGLDTSRWNIETSIGHASKIFDYLEKTLRGES